MSVVLTVDIGNTRAKYAVFDGEKIDDTGVFFFLCDDLAVLLSHYPFIKRGIISSVGGHVEECLSQCGSLEMVVLSDKTRLPFKISLPNTSQIGADRLAAMASAAYFKPSKNVLVIDIGTCITYDILTDDGFYYPGPISPGINLRFKSMHEHTRLLPLCSPTNNEKHLICKTTQECLEAGVMLGVQYEMELFIDSYSNIFNNLDVFLIGGDNIFFENKLKNCIFAESNFIFHGLRYILDYNENQ